MEHTEDFMVSHDRVMLVCFALGHTEDFVVVLSCHGDSKKTTTFINK